MYADDAGATSRSLSMPLSEVGHRINQTPLNVQCRLRRAGSLCRPTSSSCDLAEYCDGRSQWCPADVYRADGERCTTSEGYPVGCQNALTTAILLMRRKVGFRGISCLAIIELTSISSESVW
ncbi:unnamed protein product [Protopolystoma xenopodis]|uniref:Disintegrin domain-containing protein n=1 Tax=Protopolystoma xenopodis TaxID=117903 RepID=A0A3S5CTI0_9PLAT|nr:unnamed protein product [Protopolystoma xenopodis]